jgi:hypothetical protein
MNKIKIGLIINITIFILIIACDAQAKKIKIDSDISINTSYNYVWRGQLITSGVAIQPTIGSIIGGVGARMWENFDINSAEVTRNEFRLSYVTQSESLKFSVGTVFYARSILDDTMEVYVTIGEFSQLNTSITIYYDFLKGNGAFISTSYQHTFGEVTQLNVKGSLNINIGDKVMGFDSSGAAFTGLYNVELSFYSDLPLSEAISFRPNGGISLPLGPAASAAISSLSKGRSSINFYIGATMLFRY